LPPTEFLGQGVPDSKGFFWKTADATAVWGMIVTALKDVD